MTAIHGLSGATAASQQADSRLASFRGSPGLRQMQMLNRCLHDNNCCGHKQNPTASSSEDTLITSLHHRVMLPWR